MKTIKTFLMGLLVISLGSCDKKKEDNKPEVAAINVINAVVDLGAVKVNPTGKSISWGSITDQVNYGASRFYQAITGNTTLQIVRSSDTTQVVFDKGFTLKSKVYSLFLSGNSTHIDTLFREETNLPYIRLDVPRPPSADSVVNVRFANLCSGSPILNIKIMDNPGNEFNNLSYKGITAFKAYANKGVSTTRYTFEIKNAVTGDLITTYTFNATVGNNGNRFKNVTLVIKGVYVAPPEAPVTGPNAFGVFVANYF